MGKPRPHSRVHARPAQRRTNMSLPWSTEAAVKPKLSIDATNKPSILLTWVGQPEHVYQIERCPDLTRGDWLPIGPMTWGSGAALSYTYLMRPGEARMFFRVRAMRFDVEPEGVDFDTQVNALADYVVESAGTYQETVIDAIKTMQRSAKLASQYEVSVGNVVGDPGAVTYSVVEGTDKASIDPSTGQTAYLADGPFRVRASAGGIDRDVNLVNRSSQTELVSWAMRNDLTATQVLVLYNADDPGSIEVKNYYQANRPAAAGMNYLGLHCKPFERILYADYLAQIEGPVDAWMAANPNNQVRYIVMLHGLPTRLVVDDANTPRWSNTLVSVTHALSGGYDAGYTSYHDWVGQRYRFLRGQYPHWRGLVTFLGMGSVDQTKAYIDRLAAAPAKSADNLLLAGSGADNFLFDDWDSLRSGIGRTGPHYTTAYGLMWEAFKIDDNPELMEFNWVLDPTLTHIYRSPEDASGPILSAANVACYVNWGLYSQYNGAHFGGLAALDQRRIWTGDSWYAMTSFESFNGQRNNPRWFVGLKSSGQIIVNAVDTDPVHPADGAEYDIWINRQTGDTWEHDGVDWVADYNERIHSVMFPRMQYHKSIATLSGFSIHFADTEPTRDTNRDWWVQPTAEDCKMWNPDPSLQRWESPMSTFESWFSPGAFTDQGDTSQCPIVATVHTEEPYLWGGSGIAFFQAWRAGWPFAECAYAGRQGATGVMYVGDPLVCLKIV